MNPSLVSTFQGIYYLLTAIWPIVHMKSFEAVTGPKTDHWLVKTVGALILPSAVVFLYCAWQGQVSPEAKLLAVGDALAFTCIDVFYVARGRISRVYLLDALAETGLIMTWLLSGSTA